MTIWRLVRKELRHRKLGFMLAVLSVAVAVGVVAAEVVILRAHDIRTEAILHQKQAQADARLAKMEDDYRKYMKELGFNLLILPKEQQLTEFWTKGYATHTMPEENVRVLAATGTKLMRHLLPVVQKRLFWPERKRTVILIGTRGEVPIKARGQKEPMLLAVAQGQAVIGYQLATDLGLKKGDTFSLLGEDFVIESCRRQRGSIEDATIWVNLATAQRLLDMKGRINAIEALKCHCHAATTADEIRKHIIHALPDTKVVVRENKVTLRAKARDRVKAEHASALAAEKVHRGKLRDARESFAAVLVPAVLAAGAVWIALLALNNVRQRRGEIAILRAIGVRSRQVFSVFVIKAALIGAAGAVAGCAAGLAIGAITSGPVDIAAVGETRGLFDPILILILLVAAPTLCVLVSVAPAMLASRQDPAVILQEQ